MKKLFYFILFIFSVSLFSSSLVMAQDQLRDRDRDRDQDTVQQQDRDQLRDQVFGWDLMTAEERMKHRQTMRNMKTREEREAYRMEHHKMMQERARQRGVTLPPYQPGRGMGGAGMGRNR